MLIWAIMLYTLWPKKNSFWMVRVARYLCFSHFWKTEFLHFWNWVSWNFGPSFAKLVIAKILLLCREVSGKCGFWKNSELIFLDWELVFFNHRAKRGGSLFQGGSAKRERGREATSPPVGTKPPPRSRSDPYFGVGYPSVRRFPPKKFYK